MELLTLHPYQSSVPRTCWRCFCCALSTCGDVSVCVICTRVPKFGHVCRCGLSCATDGVQFSKRLRVLGAKRGHGKVDFAFVVVPVEVDLDIFASSVIYGDVIMFFECVDEVICVVE